MSGGGGLSAEQRARRRAEKRAEQRITVGFGVAALAGAGFAAGYALEASTQVMGAALGLAFGALGYGLGGWAKHLLPTGGYVEEHEGFASSARQQGRLTAAMVGAGTPVRRKGLIRMLGLALGAIGVALLFPVRSLIPLGRPDPAEALSHTAWRGGGMRLVDTEGRPVRLEDVTAETFLLVLPEEHSQDGDVPAFLVRLDPARFSADPPAGHLNGVVAYSLLCTHAGCSVSLYEQENGQMFCPCHQSAFDLLAAARPVAGPAARPLPALPIAVDPAGYLYATGDFTSPPGPGFWSRP